MTNFNKINPANVYFQKTVKKEAQKQEVKQEATLLPKESKNTKLDPNAVLKFMGQTAQVVKAESKEAKKGLDLSEAFKPYITPKMAAFFTPELVSRVTNSVKEFETATAAAAPIVKSEVALIQGKAGSDKLNDTLTPLALSLLD